jgi:Protein of unknown function (DUF1236)
MGSTTTEKCRKLQRRNVHCSGNDPTRDALAGLRAGCQAGLHHREEFIMRNSILALAAVAGVLAAPITAQAQSETVGIAHGSSVIVDDDADAIAVDQRPAFREYIVRERVPEYTIPDRVIVGGILPESGIVTYEVPQTFGVTPYRYTVVNGQTILVDPHSRRIVQVVE